MKFRSLLVLAVMFNLFLPKSVLSAVRINEIAWMGTMESQYGEWIELYNDGDEAVDLKEAILYEKGGEVSTIKLTKTIAPKSYYLIARSTPSMPDPVFGTADDLGSFGGGGLSNGGEYLVLKSASGEILDSINATIGWPAGDSEQKLTMQRSGDLWVTASATPRAINSDPIVSLPETKKENVTKDEQAVKKDNSVDLSVISTHSNPSDLSNKKETPKIFVSAGRDRLSLVDTPIYFSGRIYNSDGDSIDSGNLLWSFGDGETGTGRSVAHLYRLHGDYVVVLMVNLNGDSFISRTNVKVLMPELKISEVKKEAPSYIKIDNFSPYEANIGGWQLVSGERSFDIPKDTIILGRKSLSLSQEITGILPRSDVKVRLISPRKNIFSVFEIKSEPEPEYSLKKNVSETVKNDQPIKDLPTGEIKDEETDENNLSSIHDMILTLNSAKNELSQLAVKNDLAAVGTTRGNSRMETVVKKGVIRVASSSVIEVVEKPKSIFRSILLLPREVFGVLKGLVF